MTNDTQSPPLKSAPSAPASNPPAAPAAAAGTAATFDVRQLNVWFGSHQVLRNVSLEILPKAVTAIIGPSGCGKSTFLRSLNRMHDLVPAARVEGHISLFGRDLYAGEVDATLVRRRVGMVFQKSNPFPTMTIAENVAVGLRLNGLRRGSILRERMERSLRMAVLWGEVKDRLTRSEERR